MRSSSRSAAVLTPPTATAAQPDVPALARTRATRAFPGWCDTGRRCGSHGSNGARRPVRRRVAYVRASTLVWLSRRSRQQNEAVRLQLDAAEEPTVPRHRLTFPAS